MTKVGVIGCGNMASQIVIGLAKKSNSLSFFTYTPTQTKAEALAAKVGGQCVSELSELRDCDILLIGCKPQQWKDLAQSMMEANLCNHLCVSMLAATSFKSLQSELPKNRFIRVMPNTPIGVGLGLTLFLSDDNVKKSEQAHVLSLFKSCSQAHLMKDEKMFDQVTTVSGCGPAYVYLFANLLSKELAGFGMDDKEARELVVTLFKGSSKLMEDANSDSLDELISKVTSKGGVTIEAVNVFKDDGLGPMTKKALSAAYERSIEITSKA